MAGATITPTPMLIWRLRPSSTGFLFSSRTVQISDTVPGVFGVAENSAGLPNSTIFVLPTCRPLTKPAARTNPGFPEVMTTLSLTSSPTLASARGQLVLPTAVYLPVLVVQLVLPLAGAPEHHVAAQSVSAALRKRRLNFLRFLMLVEG